MHYIRLQTLMTDSFDLFIAKTAVLLVFLVIGIKSYVW